MGAAGAVIEFAADNLGEVKTLRGRSLDTGSLAASINVTTSPETCAIFASPQLDLNHSHWQ